MRECVSKLCEEEEKEGEREREREGEREREKGGQQKQRKERGGEKAPRTPSTHRHYVIHDLNPFRKIISLQLK